MSIEERFRLFGDPTESLGAEAVYGYYMKHDAWPLWEEAAEYRAASPVDPCDLDEANRRIEEAIAAGEVIAVPVGGGAGWIVKVDEAMADRITRRAMDFELTRRDEEEPC